MTDHVQLLDSMGTDLSVANIARVSFDKWHDEFAEGKDDRLIRYLATHGHWTPFGHCQATFRITASVFVARQLAKHQVGMVWNEVSRRYVKSEPEYWTPEAWREAAVDKKQGSGAELDYKKWNSKAEIADDAFAAAIQKCGEAYRDLLALGICEEQARAVLPLASLTTWIWTGSLAAWARVASLRCKPDAQKETRDVAEQIAGHCSELWPVSWAALEIEEN